MKTKTAADLFRQSREEWVESARHEAVKQLKVRYQITIEDVLRVCPLPTYLKRNVIGHVFQNQVFKPIGFTTAKSLAAHRHVIRIWTLREDYFSPKELEHRHRNLVFYENE